MPAKREDIDDTEIRYLYNVEHWTLQKIADYLGVALMTIYYRLHPEKKKENNEKNYEEHRDHILEQHKEYFQTENGIAAKKKAAKKYFQTENGIAALKRFRQSEKGKATKKRYWQSENGKALASKRAALRRELGFIQVNSFFIGGVWHHIDFDHVICMPAELHKSIPHSLHTGEGMEEINELAFGYITEEEFERLESGELDKGGGK